MRKKTIFFILFIIAVMLFAAYWIFRESSFTKEILSLDISGPDMAVIGEEIEYAVKYKNNGNFILQNPKLIFNMPDNSLTEDSKTRIVQDLEDIYPGQEEVIKIKTRLLGKEGDIKTAKAALSYTPKNLTVRYESDAFFDTKIDVVPVDLSFELPSQIEDGQELQYYVNYYSQVNYPLELVSLKVNPVPGFQVESSDPSSLDGQEWKLSTLNKLHGGRVTIKGKMSGNAGKTVNFFAYLGLWQNGKFIIIKEANASIDVIQPFAPPSTDINKNNNQTNE